jgi:hypothetical protein
VIAKLARVGGKPCHDRPGQTIYGSRHYLAVVHHFRTKLGTAAAIELYEDRAGTRRFF